MRIIFGIAIALFLATTVVQAGWALAQVSSPDLPVIGEYLQIGVSGSLVYVLVLLIKRQGDWEAARNAAIAAAVAQYHGDCETTAKVLREIIANCSAVRLRTEVK